MKSYLTKEDLQSTSKHFKDVPHMSVGNHDLKHTHKTVGNYADTIGMWSSILIHHQQGCKMTQLLWNSVWQFSAKLSPLDVPAAMLLGKYSIR